MKLHLREYFGAYVLVLSFTIVTTGCSSAEKKAAELMEIGSYEEAEMAYENILNGDSQNVEARAGLQKSRAKVLDTRLINIRKARLAGSSTELALLDLINIENKWKIQPLGPVAFTQREEIDYATSILLEAYRDRKFSGFPLYLEYELRRVEPLFQTSHAFEFKKLRTQAQTEGRNLCTRFSKKLTPDLVYAAQFTKRFCNFWKTNTNFKINESFLNRDLLNQVTATFELTGFTPEVQRDILQHMNDIFRSSPWYSAKGKEKLALSITGTWTNEMRRNTTQLLHQYEVQESYVEQVSVMKTRQVPYTTTNYTIDPITLTNTPVTTTQYREENYWTTEPQTKWHTAQKTFPYGGWQINQTLNIHLEGAGSIVGRPLSLAISDSSQTSDTESDVSNPSIGLNSKRATLIPDPNSWLQTHEQQLSEQFHEKVAAIWSDLYCSNISVTDYATSGNQVHRCLRLRATATISSSPIEEWYHKHFGLSREQTESLLQ